ncbi:MAG: ABC transporter ATP-binding protein [Oscillospiraceae bacterium]|nr:ABC transporter ATP-binding protein [Oscillospiraceae bacterium]
MTAVQAQGLTKKYKGKTAVDHLDLAVEKGELFALLGVNGAGKTTTIRMLTCLSRPTSGKALICGHDTVSESALVKSAVGISPQDTAVADNLTVRENLQFIAKIYGLTADRQRERIAEMQRMFSLGEVMEQRAKTLSGGWKRRVSIAMALLPEPEVLFLDEPTLGLDVLARRELWGAIESLKGRMTIILTTHYMEEAERLSDRIAIMVSGKLRAVGTLSELEALSGETGLENAFVKIAESGMGGGEA